MKKSFLFAALVVIMCAFSSCVDEPTILGKWQMNTMKMQSIVNGQVVQTVEEPVPSKDPIYWQFVDESTGKIIEYWDGDVQENTYRFNWKWDGKDCIRMEYGPGDVSYLDDIKIYSNTLTGYLDDVEVYFKGRL